MSTTHVEDDGGTRLVPSTFAGSGPTSEAAAAAPAAAASGSVFPPLKRVGRMIAPGMSSGAIQFDGGLAAGSSVAVTPGNVNVSSANRATRMRRLHWTTAATLGSVAGYIVGGQRHFWPGTGVAGDGSGFSFFFDFVPYFPLDNVPNARYFMGVSQETSANPTNVEPNSIVVAVGIGKVAASNNLCVIINGQTAQPVIDLGADFPAKGSRIAGYRAYFNFPDARKGVVEWRVENLVTGIVASGEVIPHATNNQQTPTPGHMLQPRWWLTNNDSTNQFALEIGQFQIQSEN